MDVYQVCTAVKRGVCAALRWLWRAARLAAAWGRRKAATMGVSRQIGSQEGQKHEMLLQIGRIVCARHLVSPLQDEELAPLCQKAADLDSEIRGLRQRLLEILAAPLLSEDRGAEPLGREPAESAPA